MLIKTQEYGTSKIIMAEEDYTPKNIFLTGGAGMLIDPWTLDYVVESVGEQLSSSFFPFNASLRLFHRIHWISCSHPSL